MGYASLLHAQDIYTALVAADNGAALPGDGLAGLDTPGSMHSDERALFKRIPSGSPSKRGQYSQHRREIRANPSALEFANSN